VTPRRYAVPVSLRSQAAFVAWMCAIAALIILVAGMVRPPRTHGDLISWRGLVVSFAAGFPLMMWMRWVSSAYVEVTDAGIAWIRGRKRVALQWHEIRCVEYRRMSKRLKLWSSDGRVINVERQFVGFPEIRRIVEQKTGSIVVDRRLPVPLGNGAITIEVPLWFKLLMPVLCLGALYFVAVRWFIAAFTAAPGAAIIDVCVGVLGLWLVGRAMQHHRARAGLSLSLDERGIRYRSRKEQWTLTWPEIRSAGLEHDDERSWFIVRDLTGDVVLQMGREAFNFSGSAMRRFDMLADEASRRTAKSSTPGER
jgi:hypothetical protein